MKGLLFTYGLTYGGAVISLVNPFYGLLIYISFAIIKPPALWHWSVPAGNYSRIIGIAFLVGWAINGYGDRSLGRAKPIVIAVLGYFAWVVMSTALGMQPARGTPFIEYLSKILLPFIAGVTLIRTYQQLQQLIWVILGSCAVLAYEVNLAYLSGYSVENYGFLGMDNNTFSILMTTSFGLVLVLGFEEKVFWRRFAYFGAAASMAHVPMLAFSRGGMLGVAVSAGVAVALTPKTSRSWQMIIASIGVGAVLAGPTVISEFGSSFGERGEYDGSAESRLYLWMHCADAAMKHPVFGVGQECWGLIAPTYGWPLGKEAHSLWFQTLAELGIPGLVLLLLFYFRVVKQSWRASRQTEAPWMPMVARMMIVSLSGFAVSASFVTVEGLELPFYAALIGACAVKVSYQTAGVAEFNVREHALETPVRWHRAMRHA